MTVNISLPIDVSRETIDRLQEFQTLVEKWTKTINLIAPRTISDIWTRHIVDSAQLYEFAPTGYNKWVDLGSGGGFPGIVLATIAKEKAPEASFTLIESDLRKATFLRTAARTLNLNVTVISDRIESAPNQQADVITARALAALDPLFSLIKQHQKPGGVAIIPKGKTVAEEITKAKANWGFDMMDRPSITDFEARILIIKDIRCERS